MSKYLNYPSLKSNTAVNLEWFINIHAGNFIALFNKNQTKPGYNFLVIKIIKFEINIYFN